MENAGQSVIGKDVEITGTIKSAGSVQIDGKLDGELNCAGDVVVGKSANIKGNINTNSVVIEGTIAGNVVARDKIDMKTSARVNGDIKAKRLSVEDGVTFMGRSEVNPSGSPSPSSGSGATPQPAAKPEQAKQGQPAQPASAQARK